MDRLELDWMRGRAVGGYLRRHWLALGLGALVVFSEALILTQFPIDGTDVSETFKDSSKAQETSRPIPPLTVGWVPIRARLLAFVRINLLFIDRYHDTLNAVSTLAVAIFTATLWSTTRKLYSSGEKQITLANRNAAAAEKAAEVATATLVGSNRAWIKVSAKLGDGLSITNSVLMTSIIISCENVGNAPALKLGQHVWIRPYDVSVIQPGDDIKVLCEDCKYKSPFHEFVLFAGESFPDVTQLGTWKFVTQISTEKIWRTDTQKATGVQFLIIMGCINYRFASDPDKVHQTRFMYDLVRPKALWFQEDGMPLSVDKLTLRKSMLSAGYYAD